VVVESEPGTFLYLSALLGGAVRDAATGRRLGSLREIACRTEPPFPRAARLFWRRGLLGGFTEAPWAAVREVGPAGVRLDPSAAAPIPGRPEAADGELLLECDVLDQQVVDTDGAKVVRVNDVHLFLHGLDLYLAHVDIGTRGLLRRLGWERPVVRGVQLLADVRMKESLVSWKHLHLLPAGVEDPHRATSVRLDVAQGSLADLHPAEVADLLEALDARTRDRFFGALPMEAAADALAEAEPGVAQEILGSVEEAKAAHLLEAMDPGEAADVVRDMPRPEAEVLLDAMEPGAADTVRSILTFPEETAGALMTTAFLAADPSWTALRGLQEARRRAPEAEVFNYLFALSPDGVLLGIVSLKEILQAPPRVPIRRMMTTKFVSVGPATPRAEVERIFAKYGLRALPVLDGDGRMLGAIRFRKILEGMARRP
jgi:CBS domain-containing protein